MTANKKLKSGFLIVRNVNQNLQNKIINLEKEQFTQNNTTNVKMSKYFGFSMKFQIKILSKL